jgi:hypothetical protein
VIQCVIMSSYDVYFSGYMAPEYASRGLYSIKIDVFGFGVLALVIISGRKNRILECWDQSSALAGIDRRFLLGSTVGSYRRLLLGSTVGCKVSSANGNCTRRFGAAERHTFSVFLIAI